MALTTGPGTGGDQGRRATAETSQTLERALRLLEVLAEPPTAFLSVRELAAELGISRPAVYRLLTTIEQHRLVRRDEDGRVRLGAGLLPLARALLPGWHDAALPVLRLLADDTGATAHLTVVEPGPRSPSSGEEAVAVAVVEPRHTALHVAYRVGARHRLDRGAAGRAILLARDGGTGPAYVVTEGELQAGAVGIAAPVLGVAGLEASVGLITLAGADGGGLDPARAGPRVVKAAAALAATLI